MSKILNFLTFALIALLLLANPATANITVSIEPLESKYVGDTFEIKVMVYPDGEPIAGMQLNLEYDSSRVTINNISQGTLLTSFDTFFVVGTNEFNMVENIYSAVLGPNSVTAVGDFITINVTALSKGPAKFEISNVVISSPEGDAMPLDIFNMHMAVIEYPAYDTNRDGVVNIQDIVYVAQHFNMYV